MKLTKILSMLFFLCTLTGYAQMTDPLDPASGVKTLTSAELNSSAQPRKVAIRTLVPGEEAWFNGTFNDAKFSSDVILEWEPQKGGQLHYLKKKYGDQYLYFSSFSLEWGTFSLQQTIPFYTTNPQGTSEKVTERFDGAYSGDASQLVRFVTTSWLGDSWILVGKGTKENFRANKQYDIATVLQVLDMSDYFTLKLVLRVPGQQDVVESRVYKAGDKIEIPSKSGYIHNYEGKEVLKQRKDNEELIVVYREDNTPSSKMKYLTAAELNSMKEARKIAIRSISSDELWFKGTFNANTISPEMVMLWEPAENGSNFFLKQAYGEQQYLYTSNSGLQWGAFNAQQTLPFTTVNPQGGAEGNERFDGNFAGDKSQLVRFVAPFWGRDFYLEMNSGSESNNLVSGKFGNATVQQVVDMSNYYTVKLVMKVEGEAAPRTEVRLLQAGELIAIPVISGYTHDYQGREVRKNNEDNQEITITYTKKFDPYADLKQLTAADLNGSKQPRKIAIKNVEEGKTMWFNGATNTSSISYENILQWEPAQGKFYLKKLYGNEAGKNLSMGFQGFYWEAPHVNASLQFAASNPQSAGAEGKDKFNAADSYTGDLKDLVRFYTVSPLGGDFWMTTAQNGNRLADDIFDITSVQHVYDMSDYYTVKLVLKVPEKQDEVKTVLYKVDDVIEIPTQQGLAHNYMGIQLRKKAVDNEEIVVEYFDPKGEEGMVNVTYTYMLDGTEVATLRLKQKEGDPYQVTELEYPFLSYEYDTNGTVSSKNPVVKVVCKENLPFQKTTDVNRAHWYYIHQNGQYASFCLSTKQVNFTPADDNVNVEDMWCFVGNVVDGFKIYNGKYKGNLLLTSPKQIMNGASVYPEMTAEDPSRNTTWDLVEGTDQASYSFTQHGNQKNRLANASGILAIQTSSVGADGDFTFVKASGEALVKSFLNKYRPYENCVGGYAKEILDEIEASNFTSQEELDTFLKTKSPNVVSTSKVYRIRHSAKGYMDNTPDNKIVCTPDGLTDTGKLWQIVSQNGDFYIKNLNTSFYLQNPDNRNNGQNLALNSDEAKYYIGVPAGKDNFQYAIKANMPSHFSVNLTCDKNGNVINADDEDGCWYLEEVNTWTVKTANIKGTNWGTLYMPFDIVSISSGMNAYAAKVNAEQSKLVMMDLQQVPANTGVILRGSGDVICTMQIQAPSLQPVSSNDLTGSNEDVILDDTNRKNYYILTTGRNGVGLYLPHHTLKKIGANKSFMYASVLEGMAVSSLRFSFDEDLTGIENIENADDSETIYDLKGRIVLQPTKGVYIKNGKKTYIK